MEAVCGEDFHLKFPFSSFHRREQRGKVRGEKRKKMESLIGIISDLYTLGDEKKCVSPLFSDSIHSSGAFIVLFSRILTIADVALSNEAP